MHVCEGWGQTSPRLDSHRPRRETCHGTPTHTAGWVADSFEFLHPYLKSSVSRQEYAKAKRGYTICKPSIMDGDEQLRHTRHMVVSSGPHGAHAAAHGLRSPPPVSRCIEVAAPVTVGPANQDLFWHAPISLTTNG